MWKGGEIFHFTQRRNGTWTMSKIDEVPKARLVWVCPHCNEKCKSERIAITPEFRLMDCYMRFCEKKGLWYYMTVDPVKCLSCPYCADVGFPIAVAEFVYDA